MLFVVLFLLCSCLTMYFWLSRRSDDTKALDAVRKALALIFGTVSAFVLLPVLEMIVNNFHGRSFGKSLKRKK